MSGRGMRLAWWAALAAVVLMLAIFGKDRLIAYGEIPAAPVVVIGSSLMEHAVSPLGGADASLLGDGRGHVRLARSSITEAQTVELLGLAVENGAQTVLVEANALAFDFASRAPAPAQGPIRPLVLTLSQSLLDVGNRARAAMRMSIRRETQALTQEAQKLDAPFLRQTAGLAKTYPLHLRQPARPDALAAVLKTAWTRGVEVVLIAPPRSQYAGSVMGEPAQAALAQHVRALAQSLQLPLFEPDAVWPDDHFIDLAHMNRRGRARFAQELALWRAKKP